MVAGAYVGGMIVNRVSDKAFVYIAQIIIVAAAISLLLRSPPSFLPFLSHM